MQNEENNNYKKVTVDVELDGRESKSNRFQTLIDLAEAVDAWRIFPRLFISVYIYLLYTVVTWYTGLDAPTVEQSGLISVVVGAGAAWFGVYVNSGRERPVKVPKTK